MADFVTKYGCVVSGSTPESGLSVEHDNADDARYAASRVANAVPRKCTYLRNEDDSLTLVSSEDL